VSAEVSAEVSGMVSGTERLALDAVGLRAGGVAAGRWLFEGLSLAVRAGERWAVLGPNGAGKSSLLAAMAGVFPVARGGVRIDGRPLADWPPQALADRRAWCPQFWIDPFPATVADTLRLVRDRRAWWADGTAADPALAQALADWDLAALAQADVRLLSGGERQRVAIATALLQDAALVLFDEPASHLDLAHQRLLVDRLRARADAGLAVVASLHDLNLAADLASHAVLLDGRGRAWAGPVDAVMTPALLSAAYGIVVDRVEVCGESRFWIGPLRRAENA
jgi:iron complex transport system ATP-binding protein